MTLTEGLRLGDLEDLVLPLISIDEFESKIDSDAIVIGFYVNDVDAAKDLNRFIQGSPVNILDSEVSAAPDQHGFYMVFVEILYSSKFASLVKTLVSEVSAICNINKWEMQLRGHEELIPFEEKTLVKAIKKLHDSDKKKEMSENVLNFLTKSYLRNAYVDDHLVIEGHKGNFAFDILDFGEYDTVMKINHLDDKPIGFGLYEAATCSALESSFGNDWSVNCVGKNMVIFDPNTDETLILTIRD